MKFQTLMIIKAVVCLTLGILILFAPGFTYSLFGISLDPGVTFPAREYGASLFGNLMITWFARKAIESDARRAIILGLCVYEAMGFEVTLFVEIPGLLNPRGGWVGRSDRF